jgi:hypothetical protein
LEKNCKVFSGGAGVLFDDRRIDLRQIFDFSRMNPVGFSLQKEANVAQW